MILAHILLLTGICMINTVGAGDIDVCNGYNLYRFASACQKVFKELERALIQDEANLYSLKKVFFSAPNSDPVLFKVNYNIRFGDNITDHEEVLPLCDTDSTNNSAAINISQTEVIHGWTSSGIYYIISPLSLNLMQMPLPFAILRWTHKYYNTSAINSPELDSLLWDGTYELLTIFINLYITSLSCIPSADVFNSTLEELTTYVSKILNLIY